MDQPSSSTTTKMVDATPASPKETFGPYDKRESIHMAPVIRMERFLKASSYGCGQSAGIIGSLAFAVSGGFSYITYLTGTRFKMDFDPKFITNKGNVYNKQPKNIWGLVNNVIDFYKKSVESKSLSLNHYPLLVIPVSYGYRIFKQGEEESKQEPFKSHAMLLIAGLTKEKKLWIQVFDPNGKYNHMGTRGRVDHVFIQWVSWLYQGISITNTNLKKENRPVIEMEENVKIFVEKKMERNVNWRLGFLRSLMDNEVLYPNKYSLNTIGGSDFFIDKTKQDITTKKKRRRSAKFAG